MPIITRVFRRARSAIAHRLQPTSLEHSRGLDAYYPQQPTCQVNYLWFLLSRYLGERPQGYFVEVGAFDGKSMSNTWGLAARGWHGLLVEPIPEYAAECRTNHRDHPNVDVVEWAIGSHEGNIHLQRAGPLTTGNTDQSERLRELPWSTGYVSNDVQIATCHTLDYALEAKDVPRKFDLLTIDVEGCELDVFQGFSLTRWMPKMVIIELADDHPDLWDVSTDDAIVFDSLLRAGYRVVFRDWVNTIFVEQSTWRERH